MAEKYDPAVNWTTGVDMDPNSETYGRPAVVAEYSTEQNGEDVNSTGICPAALGTKDQQPSAYSPETGLMYVPTNHICMDYEPFRVSYTAGQTYVGATLSMYPAPDSHGGMGNFIAWDPLAGEIKWSVPEQFSVWSGALATAGDVVFYGTLEGYLKAVDATTGEELYKFKTPSGIIGNVFTYEHGGKQYVGVLSGVGGWAGIGLAAGLQGPTEGLGAASISELARQLYRPRRPADGLRRPRLIGSPFRDNGAALRGGAFSVMGHECYRPCQSQGWQGLVLFAKTEDTGEGQDILRPYTRRVIAPIATPASTRRRSRLKTVAPCCMATAICKASPVRKPSSCRSAKRAAVMKAATSTGTTSSESATSLAKPARTRFLVDKSM